MLPASTFELDHSTTLADALDHLEEDKGYDVVLLDLGLPDSQGLDTLLKAREQAPHLPIVILTGFDDEERSLQALQLGAQDYLFKGDLNSRPLVRAIRYAIERHQIEDRLRLAVDELESRTAEMESFTYSVSHDLKEPLRTLEAFSRFLLEDYASVLDEQGSDYLTRLANASARLKDMIEELLMLSRLGRRPHEVERVSVRDVVDGIIAANLFTIEERGAEVIVEGQLPDVMADLTRVEQIFGNLIGNGLKFNRNNYPQVRIGVTESKDGWATFRIQDNGIGIAAEYHDRIFGIFQRLHMREDYEGTGAGLAIVKRAVEALGGRVWLESAPGSGSTFYVRMPLCEERPRRGRPAKRVAELG
jgi:light-regulated signal transduction histidine kinase (bacteriophytochrome)